MCYDFEQQEQEDRLWPWLASDCMADQQEEGWSDEDYTWNDEDNEDSEENEELTL